MSEKTPYMCPICDGSGCARCSEGYLPDLQTMLATHDAVYKCQHHIGRPAKVTYDLTEEEFEDLEWLSSVREVMDYIGYSSVVVRRLMQEGVIDTKGKGRAKTYGVPRAMKEAE